MLLCSALTRKERKRLLCLRKNIKRNRQRILTQRSKPADNDIQVGSLGNKNSEIFFKLTRKILDKQKMI